MIYQKHVNTKLRIGHGGPPLRIQCMVLCTPGMGVNLWGERPPGYPIRRDYVKTRLIFGIRN
jgi:hypothetical protein